MEDFLCKIISNILVIILLISVAGQIVSIIQKGFSLDAVVTLLAFFILLGTNFYWERKAKRLSAENKYLHKE